jgi:hypothetical protein
MTDIDSKFVIAICFFIFLYSTKGMTKNSWNTILLLC